MLGTIYFHVGAALLNWCLQSQATSSHFDPQQTAQRLRSLRDGYQYQINTASVDLFTEESAANAIADSLAAFAAGPSPDSSFPSLRANMDDLASVSSLRADIEVKRGAYDVTCSTRARLQVPVGTMDEPALLATPAFYLMYVEGRASLFAYQGGMQPLLYVPSTLLQPLDISPHGLSWFCEYAWTSFTEGESIVAWVAFSNETEQARTVLAVEVDSASGLPRSALRFTTRESFCYAAFTYGRTNNGNHWLTKVSALRGSEEGLKAFQHTLTDVRYLQVNNGVRLGVGPNTQLVDRRADKILYRKAGSIERWPVDVQDLVIEVTAASQVEAQR